MKPKPTPSITQKPGTLTTKTLKPGKFGGHVSVESFGSTETHRITVIKLKPTNRAAVQTMARRYRVKSLLDFRQGIVMELDREADPSTRVLFRVYED
jgi:hypothetical protein